MAKKQGFWSKVMSGFQKKSFFFPTPAEYGDGTQYALSRLHRTSTQYLDEYRGWTFACVQARAEAVSKIKFKLFNGDEEVFESELLDLLYKANPRMTKGELIAATQAFLDLEGNAFWFLVRDNEGKGQIREIYILRPDRITIKIDKADPLKVEGYVYSDGKGGKIPFTTKEILHFKNFNATANYPIPHRGKGIVEAAIYAIETDNEAREWNYSFFKNSARPDGLLIKDGEGVLSDDEFNDVKAQWDQEFKGSSKAHKVMIVAGGMKWEDLTRSQKDMDFIEQRRFSRDEILALFRVPKPVIGITEDVTVSNAEATDYIFASRTVEPLMERIVETLNEYIVPEFGEDLSLDFASPIPEDRIKVLTEYEKGLDKWLTRNDIRAREGLTPTDNGDQFFGTLAQIPIDTAQPPKEKAVFPRFKRKKMAKKSDDEITSQVRKLIADKFPETKKAEPAKEEDPKVPETRKLSDDVIKNYTEIWKGVFKAKTEPLKKKINAYFEKQKAEVLRNLKDELKGLEVKEFSLKAIDDFLFDEEDAVKSGISLITPFIKDYIKESGGQAITLVGADIVFDTNNPVIQRFFKQRAEFFAESINDTTRDELFSALKEGIAANEGLEDLSKRVADVYDQARDYRSDVIARTEISASSNFGAEQGFTQAGIDKVEWLIVDPQDEDCLSNAGEVVEIGKAFPSGDERPPVHPNCVCTILPVFE